MKFAILADIHGNAFALKKVLEDIQQEGIIELLTNEFARFAELHSIIVS